MAMKSFMDTAFYNRNLNKKVTGKQINDETNNETFYICIKNEYMYKLGLNEDINCDFCEYSKLNFTDKYNIMYFIHRDGIIGNIKIPDDAICHLYHDEIICNKLILELVKPSTKHELTKDIYIYVDSLFNGSPSIDYMDENFIRNNPNYSKAIYIELYRKYQYSIYDDHVIKHHKMIDYAKKILREL
jgi:hypothetical protein